MHGREHRGLHASAVSVAKSPYRDAADGISLTTTVVPQGLGRTVEERVENLTRMLDAFFSATGYHVNVNMLNREALLDAMERPARYPHLTIRVSGYAVNFVRLSRTADGSCESYVSHNVMTDRTPQRATEARSGQPVRASCESSLTHSGRRIQTRNRYGQHRIHPLVYDGATLDGPGVRVVAWLCGCQFRCLYCHNPDTWNMTNGSPIPLERAVAQLGKYRHGLVVMRGGLTISGGELLM